MLLIKRITTKNFLTIRSDSFYFLRIRVTRLSLPSSLPFKIVFAKAIGKSEESDSVKQRVLNLIDLLPSSTSLFTTRSLFEQHKLIFTSQMLFQILFTKNEIDQKGLEFLPRYSFVPSLVSPLDLFNEQSWAGIKAPSSMEEFYNPDHHIELSAKRWKKFVESEASEKEKFP